MPSQYSDYFDSAEPEPIPDAHPWAYQINGSLERLDRSTGAMVQLFRDGDDAYAVHDGDVLASGTSHGSVIQSAIDWIFDTHAVTGTGTSEQVQGWIDGGGETYLIGSQLHLKDQVGLSNLDLDGQGGDFSASATASGEPGLLRIAPTDGRRYMHRPQMAFVRVRNTSAGPGIVGHNVGFGYNYGVTAYNVGSDGIVLEGCIGVALIGGFAEGCGRDGIVLTDSSDSHGNLNRLYHPNSAVNGRHGIHVYKRAQTGDDTDLNRIISGNIDGNTSEGILLGDGARSTVVADTWFETDQTLTIHGTTRTPEWNRIIRCHCPTVTIDSANRTQFINNVSPVQYPIDVQITSNATDTRLERNNIGSLTDNGARTRRNGTGTNAGDPTAGTGEWAGSGEEGVVVYDTSVARPWPSYRWIGEQWQQA